jgi:hypothetical protein|tara:strand:- start:748 stop:1065 length:318 start_codon:yes stop_codon:yes gene_type:complete
MMGKKKIAKKRGGGSMVKKKAGGAINQHKRMAMGLKDGGPVGKKQQGYKDRKDESIAMRIKKKRTPAQLKASRDESYGKFGKGTGKGKINKRGGGIAKRGMGIAK